MLQSLPQVYDSLLPRELLDFKISERLATCSSCAMSPEKYKAHLKCCTFEPYLPNFLVGSILKAEMPGAAAVRRKIALREYSLPIGMLASVRFQMDFQKRRETDFGKREDWLCLYYNRVEQNCGIWQSRGTVCTSFFCKSSYGDKGMQFWSSLSDYLAYVEMALMEEALVELGFSPRQVSQQVSYLNRKTAVARELKSDQLEEKLARELWNGYFDDQEGFFGKTADFAASLSRSQFEESLGEKGAELQNDLLAKMRSLNE